MDSTNKKTQEVCASQFSYLFTDLFDEKLVISNNSKVELSGHFHLLGGVIDGLQMACQCYAHLPCLGGVLDRGAAAGRAEGWTNQIHCLLASANSHLALIYQGAEMGN